MKGPINGKNKWVIKISTHGWRSWSQARLFRRLSRHPLLTHRRFTLAHLLKDAALERKEKDIAWKGGTSFMFEGEGKVGERLTSEGMILAYR